MAVSLPHVLLDEIELMSRRLGESRSAVFERALTAFCADATRASLARQYADGYRKHPESVAEIRTAVAYSLVALASEPWDA